MVAVARVTDGDTFFGTDGIEIDLAGVLAPGSGGERVAPPVSAAAKDVLRAVLANGPITIAAGPPDRYGRLKAQVFANGEWVQRRLISAGLVRAAPDLVSAPCTSALLALEATARGANAGHWADGVFTIHTPVSVRGTGTYQIVEGRVVNSTDSKGHVYLDFGADWHTDFTATIAPEDKAAFRKPRVDWKALAGKRVRVRGWLEYQNGPMIGLHAPGEIEFLDAMPKPVIHRAPHAKTAQTARPEPSRVIAADPPRRDAGTDLPTHKPHEHKPRKPRRKRAPIHIW